MNRSILNEIRFILSTRKKAYYIGWNGYGNLGDEVLLRACEKLFRSKVILYKKKKGKKINYYNFNSEEIKYYRRIYKFNKNQTYKFIKIQ